MLAKPIVTWQTNYEIGKRIKEAEEEKKKKIQAAQKQEKLILEKVNKFKIQADRAELQAKKAKAKADRAEGRARRAKQQTEQAEEQSRRVEQRARQAEQQSRQAEQRARQAEQQARHQKSLARQAEQRTRNERRRSSMAIIVLLILGSIWTIYHSYIVTRLDRINQADTELTKAQKDFESGNSSQLNALIRAMRMKNELLKPLKELNWVPFVKTQKYKSDAKKPLQIILENIQQKNRLQLSSPILSAGFNSDGQNLAIVTTEKVRLWHWKDSIQPDEFGDTGNIGFASFSSDGDTLAIISSDGIQLFDLQNDRFNPIPVIEGSFLGKVLSVSPSNDRQIFATGSIDGTVSLWNSQGTQISEFTAHRDPVWSMSFSHDGQYLATGSADGTIRIWNLEVKELTEEFEEFKGHQEDVVSISFSPDGNTLASGSADGKVRLWDLQGEQRAEFQAHQRAVWSLSFAPDGQQIATGSADGTTRLWNLQGFQLAEEFKGHQKDVLSVSFSSDGNLLATGSADGNVLMWNLEEQLSLDDKSLDELFNKGCEFLQDYLATHSKEQKELSEQCSSFDQKTNN